MIQVVAHGRHNECQCLQGGEDAPLHQPQVLEQQEGKVCDGEGVQPVVVGRVPVPFTHHEGKPEEVDL